jgi:hypothetical protein
LATGDFLPIANADALLKAARAVLDLEEAITSHDFAALDELIAEKKREDGDGTA